MKRSTAACSPRSGRMSQKERDALPASAFGLPKQRKYPMFRVWGDYALPDPDHARTAKGYALVELERGRLTQKQIVRKADAVIATCHAVSKAPRSQKKSNEMVRHAPPKRSKKGSKRR